uniref:NADH-ubiquinone oxidoreductase chain 4 n=1 Tax=Hyposoter sp. ZJUH_2016018 TaxID=2491160 RepID=A0A3Q8UA51_9HYME|nr:NADH dehydrogenase subunit 4 [Hyposoter sp. ZJUH_2016018]
MMKLIMMILFTYTKINKYYIQLYMNMYMYLIFFLFIIKFPLNFNNYFVSLYYIFGMDFYSWGLMLLSIWIIILMLMSSNVFLLKNNYKYYKNLIFWMLMFLLMCFFSMNFFLFYFFFESSLIPVFMLIMGWGNQVERIQAGFYMMLYTLFGSMPLFLMIMFIYKNYLTMDFNLVYLNKVSIYNYVGLILGFLIKLPMFFFHLWLPKAHVEAPIVGSMILAGVMLKLGSYGLMRVFLLMKELCLNFNKFIMILSLMGGLISSLICLIQIDLKMLIAYSSVVHMSILLSGLMTLFNMGYYGGLLMMISHGLCSSGLFFLLNINYERLNSRSLYLNKGMINLMPSLTLMWFLMSSSNLSFPFSLNLFSEFFLLSSLLMWSISLMMMLILLIFFSSCYSLYLYSYSQHGKLSNLNLYFMSVKVNDFMIILMHWIPLNLIFILMYMFI